MILFSPAKINIGLHILEKRPDGFHNLDTLMHPIPFNDIIEIKVNSDTGNVLEFSSSGVRIPGNQENNLCVQAFRLFNSTIHAEHSISIHLHKKIPVGAGLGGGSSNASSVLLGLNQLSGNILSLQKLSDLAAQLGSDCPLFIQKKAMMASGRGEILKDTSVDLQGMYLVICNPGIVIPTADAFSRVSPYNDRPLLETVLSRPVSEWKDHIMNDFEESIFALHREIEVLKRSMYRSGALFASMSGSGSSVYGFFRSTPQLADDLVDTLIWQGKL